MVGGSFFRSLLALLLAEATFVSCSQNRTRLVIVGAGVSGIGAATRLIECGFQDFKILEAENRIGGRVHTERKDGVVVDYGAHWVHGGKGNAVYDMAAPLGLLATAAFHDHFITVFSDGSSVQTSDPMRPDLNPHEEDATNLRNVSLKDVLYWRAKPVFERNLTSEQTTALMKVVEQMVCTVEGCDDLGDVSAVLSEDLSGISDTDDYIWKNDGYGAVIDLLLKRHEKSVGPAVELGDRLQLNTEVEKIKVREDGGGVEVHTKSGQQLLADLVLVTVSVGVLKERQDTLFQPPLPTEKKDAINALGFGTIGKIILRFPHAWWPTDSYGFEFAWLEKDKANYKGEFSWETEVSIFAYDDHAPTTLTSWTVGEAARAVERTPIEGIQRACMRLFRKFLGSNYTIPEPIKVIKSSWGTNPHFLGSYSYRRLEAERHDVSHIRTPLLDKAGNEVVFFAGEATHPYSFATVHGAMASGWREAERILPRLQAASPKY